MFTCTLHRCETKWCTYMTYCDNVHIHIINSQFSHLPSVDSSKTPALMLCCCQVCSWLCYELDQSLRRFIQLILEIIAGKIHKIRIHSTWVHCIPPSNRVNAECSLGKKCLGCGSDLAWNVISLAMKVGFFDTRTTWCYWEESSTTRHNITLLTVDWVFHGVVLTWKCCITKQSLSIQIYSAL